MALQNGSKKLDLIDKESYEIMEARDYFIRAVETRPKDPKCHHYYAKFLETINEFNESEISYLSALKLNPNSIDTLIDYSNFLNFRNQRDDQLIAQRFLDRVEKVKSFSN